MEKVMTGGNDERLDRAIELIREKYDEHIRYFQKGDPVEYALKEVWKLHTRGEMNKVRKTHELKIAPENYMAVLEGKKTFEVRYNDRDYMAGDRIVLREYADGKYTGRAYVTAISYVFDDEEYCKEGYVILGIKG